MFCSESRLPSKGKEMQDRHVLERAINQVRGHPCTTALKVGDSPANYRRMHEMYHLKERVATF